VNPRLLPSASVARSVLRSQGDTRLADLARAGSEPAFEAIVSRYRRSLVRYCASVVGEGDAEEVVQEALLKAHAALLRGDPVRRLSPWLHVVAYHTALSYLRARTARPQAADADYDWCATLDTSAEHREELVEVLDAVRSLPDRQRDAIVMREFEGRSYDEIATRLGSSQGAVRQLLHRARSSMRQRVAALLPLEPLARWALTGVGGEAASGAGLSGACVVGAKACAALLLPATIAVVAASPSPTPKPKTAARTQASPTAIYVPRSGARARMPAAGPARLATVAGVATRRASMAPARHAARLTLDAAPGKPSRQASSTARLAPARSNQPQTQSPASVSASAQVTPPRQSATASMASAAPSSPLTSVSPAPAAQPAPAQPAPPQPAVASPGR